MRIIIALCFISTILRGQQVKDTIFLTKEKTATNTHIIYIEPNNSSEKYKTLIDFSSFPKTTTTEKIDYEDLPEKWIPLYSYKGNFYVFSPCDFSNNQKVEIHKKNILFNDFETYNFPISTFQKLEGRFIIDYKGFNKQQSKLEIFLVNKEKGIAVFKYTRKGYKIGYKLMVDAEKAQLYSLIVNDCVSNKTKEYDFETIDFETMIKRNNTDKK